MKIERVTLENFRQYYGKQQILFAKDEKQNTTVIHGVNGAGKTSLFLAINWCLYGEGVNNIGQIISKEAASKARVGEIVEAKVNIVFIHQDKRYTASRKLTGQKKADETVAEIKTNTEFILTYTGLDGIAQKASNPIGVMNTILPNNVRTYFLFDGEKIDNFARPDQAEEVKTAIYQVLDLEVLKRAQRHLHNAAKELRSELKQMSTGETRKLIEQDEQVRALESTLKEQQENYKAEEAEIQKQLNQINTQLRNLEAASELQKRHDQLSEDIQFEQEQYRKIIKSLASSVSTSYVVLTAPAIHQALAILDEKRQRGEIPSNIREQFIQDLLSRHTCICGRPFSEHDDASIHLRALLDNATPSDLEDDIIDTTGILRGLLNQGERQQELLNQRMSEQVTLQDRISSLIAQRDDINRQMQGVDVSEVRNLTRRRDEYATDQVDNRANIKRADEELEAIRDQIKELEKQIEHSEKSDQKARFVSRKVELAQRAADEIEKAYDSFAEQKRLEIEREARSIFQRIAWKGDHFQDLRLTEDYRLEVLDRYGTPTLAELSAGERQVLSLSFITGMAMIAQREAPLVMDTPFGRLSSNHREAITETLPRLVPQLVLFVTDEELRDKALNNLEPYIDKEYRLNFNPDTSCTTIEVMR